MQQQESEEEGEEPDIVKKVKSNPQSVVKRKKIITVFSIIDDFPFLFGHIEI